MLYKIKYGFLSQRFIKDVKKAHEYILNREECLFHKIQIVFYKERKLVPNTVGPLLIIRIQGKCTIISGDTLLNAVSQ